MTIKTEVIFSHPHRSGDKSYEVGDRAELELLDAKNLVRAGVATYPTKAAATKAEGEAGEEKTTRAVKAKSPSSS